MNSECGSDQRTSGIESYVRFRRIWRSVSQRRMPRETRSMNKDLSTQAMVIPVAKATMEKE